MIDWFTKIVHYEPVKVTIKAPGFAKIIINIVVKNYGFSNLMIIDWGLLFTLKF